MPAKGQPMSAEHKAKISAATKGKPKPAHAEKMRAYWASPGGQAAKARQAEVQRAAWAAYRAGRDAASKDERASGGVAAVQQQELEATVAGNGSRSGSRPSRRAPAAGRAPRPV